MGDKSNKKKGIDRLFSHEEFIYKISIRLLSRSKSYVQNANGEHWKVLYIALVKFKS